MHNAGHHIIRGYKPGDEKEITALFREVFGKDMSLDQWKWKYSLPGNGKIYSKVAEDTSGNIVGHAGAIPLRGIFKNEDIPFFHIVDVMVHPKARGFLGRKNVFNDMMKNLFEDLIKECAFIFCYGFPGNRPFIIGERISVYEKIEQAFENIKTAHRSFVNLYTVQGLDWDDRRLDDLWSLFSNDFPLALIRDKKYLYWRYAMNPFFSYQLFGFFLSGRLKGWVVIKIVGDEVFVVDLLAKPARYRSILNALQNYFVSRGGETLHFWLPERWRKKTKGYGLQETPVVVTNMVWNLPLKTSTAQECLYYTMGDTDIF